MSRRIARGDTGAAVRDVQRRLARALDTDVAVDGVFGGATEQTVRRFQRERGLPAHGIVDAETWRGLVEAGYRLGDRLLWQSRAMMRGDDVRDVQQRLNQLGFDAGPEDGIFGPLARTAVEEFQRNVGLDVDGVVGPETIAALGRLRRAHQSAGLAARAREREWLRRLSGRGLQSARVLIDPAGADPRAGPHTAGAITAAEVTWALAARTAAQLAAHGTQVTLSRGPRNAPAPAQRARLANEQGVDVVLSLGLDALATPAASGAATFYFGSPHFVSEAGLRLAEFVQAAMVGAGCRPDCRVHPSTATLLRETRMPAVRAEPGFVSSPSDRARLEDAVFQDRLARALADAIRQFFEVREAREGTGAVPTSGSADRTHATGGTVSARAVR